MSEAFEIVIGLEVHVELATESKMFCSCPTSFGAEPNTHVCPVCMGLPGTLPTLNKRAVELAIKAGLATGCRINEITRLDRKNYFYPDLPKAYQISQYELPLCYDGAVTISGESGSKRVGITRIHIEEDAGKLVHDGERGTLIDYNRCGVPLIEIVSEPQISSAAEARSYLNELRTILIYAGISHCKMNEGAFRCDVNLSVRKKGDTVLGVRTEMKNINSFSFVAKAIEYEAARQIEVLKSGGSILPETRRFDPDTGKTYPMRIKESADDYRFFPEPDILPFSVSDELISRLGASVPTLPDARRELYMREYQISEADARVITSKLPLAEYFEATAKSTKYARIAANFVLGELAPLFDETGDSSCAVSPEALGEISTMFGEKRINSSTAKALIKELLGGKSFSPIKEVARRGLEQITDETVLEDILRGTLKENTRLLEDIRNGKKNASKAAVGQVMARTAGRADPSILGNIITKVLNELV